MLAEGVALCAVAIPAYFLMPNLLLDEYPDVPRGVVYFYGVMCIACLFCVISMLRWKRRGFWGLLIIGIVGTILNAYYFDLFTTALGVASIMITAAFLFLGGSDRLWNAFAWGNVGTFGDSL